MEKNKGNGVLVYILAIFFTVISSGILYYLKKADGTEFEKENIRKSLNFEIIFVICALILGILSGIYVFYIIYILAWLIHTVINILAALTANKGEYPNMYIPIEIIKK